jgi:broad specificity phosphatase PhoE
VTDAPTRSPSSSRGRGLLYLIRHVEVELRDGVPPEEWPPTPAGLEAADRLAGEPFVRDLSLVATSPEPKAVATARPVAASAGLELRVEDDLREARRPKTPILERDAYVALVARYLAGEEIAGWEPAAAARARFAGCVERLAAEARGPLAVVTHGLVISLFLGYGVEKWRALRLPDVRAAPTRV